MQFFKHLTDPALKRLYKFVLKRMIGRFLAADELDLDQLDVHLRSGRMELCDLLLNADVLNAELCEPAGLPFRVKKGYLGSVRVAISYANIMSESCLVEVDDIEIVLVPVEKYEREEMERMEREAAAQSASGSGRAQQTNASANVSDKATQDTEPIDEVSQEGLDFVASWIEQVTSKIKVTLSNICLRLETGEQYNGRYVALVCRLEWAQLTDESAAEVQSVYGRSSFDHPAGMYGSQTLGGAQSMAASSLFGISQKGIKFRGITMDLHLSSDDDGIDEPLAAQLDTLVVHPFMDSDRTRQCYVQVKVSHYDALEAPTVDADIFFHSIRMVIQPQHFPEFGKLIDAFFAGSQGGTTHSHDAAFGSASMYQSVCESRPKWLIDEAACGDTETTADGAGVDLSYKEFQRIEQLLTQYRQTHEDLMRMSRRTTSDAQRPTALEGSTIQLRKLSLAESVESVGLSDLDDEDDFFECETGAAGSVMMGGSGAFGSSSMMGQSMYASARYDPDDSAEEEKDEVLSRSTIGGPSRASRQLQNRVKLHLLEFQIVLLYDDLPDDDDELDECNEELGLSDSQRPAAPGRLKPLPSVDGQERLEIVFKDVICSSLMYSGYTIVTLTIGTLEVAEKILPRMSLDIVEDESAMLTTWILKFADYSPATGRKVHLSANLSVQVRLDMKNEEQGSAVSALSVQIKAQPLLFEWDMYILDRAHRLMALLEDPSAKGGVALAPREAKPADEFDKKLDLTSECVQVTLRFPMVNSDLIRFGKSSKRGLCEDKLVVTLEGVRLSSSSSDADIDPECAFPTEKSRLPWMSQFDAKFDAGKVVLVTPEGKSQRSSRMDKTTLFTVKRDDRTNEACKIRFQLQTPSPAEVRSAVSSKQNLAQDASQASYVLPPSGGEDVDGDDNDGGRVGLNGWSLDAVARTERFEECAAASALLSIDISVPRADGELFKSSLDRLMVLFDALLMINPIDVNTFNQMLSTATLRNRLKASYMSTQVLIGEGAVKICDYVEVTKNDTVPGDLQTALNYHDRNGGQSVTEKVLFSYHFAFEKLKIFQVSQWMSQLVSRVHVVAHNVTLLEEDSSTKTVVPIIYKTPHGVSDAPLLFIGVDIVDQTNDMREMKVELHLSHLSLRYDVRSKWLFQMLDILLMEYPAPIIPLDSASTSPDEYEELFKSIEEGSFETVNLAVAPKTVFTKLFVNFYDTLVDYAPIDLISRVIVVLGTVSVSSNVVSTAVMQGYKITANDMELFLTQSRTSYDEVDESILGKELFTKRRGSGRKTVSFAQGVGADADYPSLQTFLEKYGFLQLITMDVVDVFLRAVVPPPKGSAPGVGALEENKSAFPELSVELNLGTANIYACFDSFNTFIELLSNWADQLAIEQTPKDTTAYVGLDRVNDSAGVSVITNLSPAAATLRPIGTSATPTSGVFAPSISAGSNSEYSTSWGASDTSRGVGRTRLSSGGAVSESVDSRADTESMGILSQIDENAFGGGKRIFPGTMVATDTEARLLRTRLDGVQKEKQRMVMNIAPRDDEMSATELRSKYARDEKPKVRINELVIEDYYSQNRSFDAMDDAPGAFLMDTAASASPSAEHPPEAMLNDPWFTSEADPLADGHPVGSLPDEQAARWIPPSRRQDENDDVWSQSSFEPVDESTPKNAFAELEFKAPISTAEAKEEDSDGVEDSEDDEFDMDRFPVGAFPAASKNWWGLHPPQDVELSELQTDETGSSFSHHLEFFGDDESQSSDDASDDAHDAPNALSMSIIDAGDEEGTEVELDFTMDRELQTSFNRLMDLESSDGREAESLLEEEELGRISEAGESTASTTEGVDRSHPIPMPRKASFSSTTSSQAPSFAPSQLSPPDEPTARWFYDEQRDDGSTPTGPPSRIYPHHVEVPIGGSASSLSFGEKECEDAIKIIARENATRKIDGTPPIVIQRVLLRNFNICMRFFGGNDWTRDAAAEANRLAQNASASADAVDKSKSGQGSSSDRKEQLLNALLDDYVPSGGGDLFGAENDGSLFTGARSAPSTFLSDRRPASASASGAQGVAMNSRKRSLKGGRKTEEMLELTVTRIQLRLDMFNEDELQPLASNAVLALGDIEILDYISTSQIRKIICYWKSDVTHPRESGSSMVHVHLMTVRPGPNLCEEHRLKVKMLPLRINLDQEVVNFLRQFVPKEDPTVRRRSPSSGGRNKAPFTMSGGEVEEEDDVDVTPHGVEGTEMSVMTSAVAQVNETPVSLGGWFFQSIDIRPCKIKIDYRPNHVDYAALRAGDYLEVINLFVLEGMELVLRRVKMSGIDGWPALGEQVLMSWVNDISRHQIHKCVASVSMPPLRPFANIGSGAADLILLPMEHYNRDRRLVRGLKKGAKSFLKSVTIETLNTASKVAQGTQALLEHADDAVSASSAHRRRQMKYRQAGSRIKRNSRSMGGGGIRHAQDAGGGIGGRQYLTQQPSNATEGLYQAYDSLSRELHVAAKTIVAVPLVEYKKTGSQGYVRSVIRAVPVAVLRPMIGATEAVSKALIGVRNAVDPELKEDIENKFKDFGGY